MMERKSVPLSILRFYLDGFRNMKLGKTLWLIILVKLFIMFFILRLFFFPRVLDRYETTAQKEDHVGRELIERAIP